jgi:hypothetical protein
VREAITHFYVWGPGAISIAVALGVAVLASSRRVPPATLMNIGLVFEVGGAYGIAFATVDDVILSCLEKDPARRPQNAGRLDALLAACGSERPWRPQRAQAR